MDTINEGMFFLKVLGLYDLLKGLVLILLAFLGYKLIFGD